MTVALVSLLIGGFIAYFLTERWQRWRQRRDFQHEALVKFSQLTEEVFRRLSELLMTRDRIRPEDHQYLRREYISRRGPLYAMDLEITAVFKNVETFRGFLYLRDIMRVLYRIATEAPSPLRREYFEPIQDCLAAQRRLVATLMSAEMGLLSKKEMRAAVKELEPKAHLPEGVSIPAEGEGA